jgi:acyl transferase domain-containing protein/acyl carrier protein
VDWRALYIEPLSQRIGPRRIGLPTYPFAREQYWFAAPQASTALAIDTPQPLMSDASPIDATRAPMLLYKRWQPTTTTLRQRHIAGRILIAADARTESLARQVAARLTSTQVLTRVLIWPLSEGQLPDIDFKTCSGWIDLIGCAANVVSLAGIEMLQRLIEHGPRTELTLLGVTRGLEACASTATVAHGGERAALYRLLPSEYPRLRSRHVDIDPALDDTQLAQQIVAEFAIDCEDAEICYRQAVRYRAELAEYDDTGLTSGAESVASRLTDGVLSDGVLWITGGTRGLGLLCAQHFVARYGVRKLVLSGRRAFPPRTQWTECARNNDALGHSIRLIQALESQGATVHVSTVDLTDVDALRTELQDVKRRWGAITGVIHSAGVADLDHPAFMRKPLDAIARVFAPKVTGLNNLLECVAAEPLKFALLFSSVSAVVPRLGAGQSDYAMANAYMDYVAQARAPHLPIISLQWGNWQDTGMRATPGRAYREAGLQSHTDVEGLALLDRVLAQRLGPVVMSVVADRTRCNPAHWLMHLATGEVTVASTATKTHATVTTVTSLEQRVGAWLRSLIAAQLALDADRLDVDAPLQDYGADSVMLAQTIRLVGRQVDADLDPSILYEYPTVRAFARWLSGRYGETLLRLLADDSVTTPPTDASPAVQQAASSCDGSKSAQPPVRGGTDIAVIGMSCRFPDGGDLASFWQLLHEGRTAIRRVPFERWGHATSDVAAVFNDANRFDPGFFRIHENDARAMDPQALLVLEESLKLWCDAGYTVEEIRQQPIGVYLGGRSRHWPDADAFESALNPILAVGQNYLAANISRHFDLRGPSLVIDTACSSALVAMDLAARALRSGDIDAALVGGVNLLETDAPLRLFERRGILSREPVFHLLDRRASGAVLGEGVGLVLLKRLDRAIADGDRIYAVIKGIAVNNDGRTAGPASPNPQAQKDVMRAALDASGSKAADIAHIELNGSGSEVNDLLELKAIEAIYRTDNREPCQLGSMKPNIGHPLCAEGIASFIKVVLMLSHRQQVPFLSAQEPLTHYDLAASPFRLSRMSSAWEGAPLAAISSFADGGTNAHVIVQGWETNAVSSSHRTALPPPALHPIFIRAAGVPPMTTRLFDITAVEQRDRTAATAVNAASSQAGVWEQSRPKDVLTLTTEHPVIRDHVIHGEHLLPGLAYIDLFYQLLRRHSRTPLAATLKGVTIYQPLIVQPREPLELEVCWTRDGAAGWQIAVERRGTAGEKLVYATANISEGAASTFDERVNLANIRASASKTINVAEVYADCRSRGMVHESYMQVRGTLYLCADAVYVDCSLDERAAADGKESLFHPALIDGCTVALCGVLDGFEADQTRRLFLPLYYEAFRATAPLQTGCIARIKRSSLRQRNDLRYISVEFFDEAGNKVAELTDLAAKLVRDPALINGDLVAKSAPAKPISMSRERQSEHAASAASANGGNAQCLVQQLLAQQLDISPDAIDVEVGYYELGLSSQGLLQLVKTISDQIGVALPPTLLFEYPTVASLAQYLQKNHEAHFAAAVAVEVPREEQPTRQVQAQAQSEAPAGLHQEDIAIIGMSGRFPKADTLQAFWQNLLQGVDCVTEVPPERWNWQQLSDIRSASGKAMSRWGGFIEHPDHFDPRFFRISPREAETMDPQERLFLEVCWEAIEDSGYTPQTLAAESRTPERHKVGVFAGVMHTDYALLGAAVNAQGVPFPIALSTAGIANRVSYVCGFHGPSMAVDTVCSSSLVAVHLAIESLRRGESRVAIAGGVNLSLHPGKYLTYGLMDMHASDGRCHTFGAGGDGYVSAEGIGAVILKPLSRAVADGDHVYAVIKASSINHVGTASGFTVPSPVAQADAIVSCLEASGIDPRTISYVEAHGTGTSLGDPIEMQGLSRAYRQFTADRQYCAIGSVKSNIGHAESAAGISGLIKVALQLKHRTLVPSLHADIPNPHIDWENSPFVVQRSLQTWQPASQVEAGREVIYPLRAGLSSFGACGANAHLILEEGAPTHCSEQGEQDPAVVVLSARTEAQLDAYVRKLAEFAASETFSLANLAYTLQVGRVAQTIRLACVVNDIDGLRCALDAYLRRELPMEGVYRGDAKRRQDSQGPAGAQTATPAHITGGINLAALAEAWVCGGKVDWLTLYRNATPRRMSLPTYPFANERYWLPDIPSAVVTDVVTDCDLPQPALVPPALAAKEQPIAATNQQLTETPLLTFEESWVETPLASTTAAPSGTWVCLLDGAASQQALSSVVAELAPAVKLIFVGRGTRERALDAKHYEIAAADGVSYARILARIREEHGAVDAMLYLWALDDKKFIEDSAAIFHVLQALGHSRLACKRLLLVGSAADEQSLAYLESWIGIERSAALVLPNTPIAAVLERAATNNPRNWANWARRLCSELAAERLCSVLYRDEKRHVCRIHSMPLATNAVPLRQGGTYLITGGSGGLGALVATHLAKQYAAKLVLIGRSPLDASKQAQLRALQEQGGQALYFSADVTDAGAMRAVLAQAQQRFGNIHGVIHAAGVAGGRNVLEKDLAQFQTVLAPKIRGTLVLDEVLQGEALDFVCYFASVAAVLGDFGACDYAMGNRFQLSYARANRGRAIAIAWPLWADGGINVGDETQTHMYLKSSGQRLLRAEEGMAMFERLLAQNSSHPLVMAGQPERIERFFGITSQTATAPPAAAQRTIVKARWPQMKGFSLEQCVNWDLKEHTGQVLKIARDQLDDDENLADLGFDSVRLTELAGRLSAYYGIGFTPALFFSHPTLAQLGDYLLATHRGLLETFYCIDAMSQTPIVETRADSTIASVSVEVVQRPSIPEPEPELDSSPSAANEPIAIIGMSGRFPGARTVDELWRVLSEGCDLVAEVPPERFDWRDYYGNSVKDPTKSNGKWLATLPGVDEFDPAFFEISPRDAELMDPRQRLLLQEAWRALEDAGYGKLHLERHTIGMFVGVEQGDYQQLTGDEGGLTANHDGVLAARLAYVLNLNGPTFAINTACSSGLVAAHQACLNLRAGECDTAIVAAANVVTAPQTFVTLAQAGLLSNDGKCHAFSKNANGMVPGEAVAALVLKRLSQAQADGDPIYAVIRGSGINYDGKTNGITAPSGAAQTQLLQTVYDRYRVDPAELDYIVTHGTGTRLGDPVEINALNDAFKRYTQAQHFCALTSIKGNLGHAFAASGLVSMVGLVQALRQGTIPASLHCEEESDYIDWSTSPFYVNKETKPWPVRAGQLRLGAVSSFGMSGTNAHMVVQNHAPDVSQATAGLTPPYFLLALSAKTPEALQRKAEDLSALLRDRPWSSEALRAMSYTLLAGRQHFTHRFAAIIQDRDDALSVLQHMQSKESLPNRFRGQVARAFMEQKVMTLFARDLVEKTAGLVDENVRYRENLLGLADLYCQGYEIPWSILFGHHTPQRVNLPGYPFARERYWAPQARQTQTVQDAVQGNGTQAWLHPLVQANTSNLNEQRFSSTFTGEEFFLKDHMVQGRKVLPGVAQLEMARQAVRRATGHGGAIGLEGVVFARPVVVGEEGLQVHAALEVQDDGAIGYELYSGEGKDEVVHGQGRAVLGEISAPNTVNLPALQERVERCLSGERCYEAFAHMGLAYGASFRGVQRVQAGRDEAGVFAIGEVSLPESASNGWRDYELHPSLMDAALQASMGLIDGEKNGEAQSEETWVPFALERLEVFGALPAQITAVIRPSMASAGDNAVRKLDVSIVDASGAVCVQFSGLSARVLHKEVSAAEVKTVLFQPTWQAQELQAVQHEWQERHVLLCGVGQAIKQGALGEVRVVQLSGSGEAGELATRRRRARCCATCKAYCRPSRWGRCWCSWWWSRPRALPWRRCSRA